MCEKSSLCGVVTAREEFLYPDMQLDVLPQTISVAMPRNGRPGIQLLLRTAYRWNIIQATASSKEALWC